MRILIISAAATVLLGCATTPAPDLSIPAHGVIGVQERHLDPEFWIEQTEHKRRTVLDPAAIAAQNQKLVSSDKSVHDVAALPATLPGARVREWVTNMSERPTGTLFDEQHQEVSSATLDELLRNSNVDAVPDSQATRFGMVVRRSDLRTFPTRLRVFRSRGDNDIDRFQEHALFTGTPVAVVHESRDGKWWFVVSSLYAAWIDKADVAIGTKQQVFDYTRREPFLIVMDPMAKTVFTPEQPAVSESRLEMGQRVPLLSDWPANREVNGQHPYTSHVIELPLRNADGSLGFSPALLPKTATVADDYLVLTRENVIRQSFKFLGERYGWGHSYNGRDCSGFVSEVYRSFGVQLPRNTRDQAVSPALNRIAFTADDGFGRRIEVLRQLQVGDLIYIPGHVMMVIGHDRGMPYVSHNTTGITYRDANGKVTRVRLNGVAVTPLTPLLGGEEQSIVERISSIQRIR